MPAILFVCTANICRSPMAVALFRQKLEGRPDEASWRIDSAGTWGLIGATAASKSQEVMRQRQADLSTHRARRVTRTLLRVYNLILVMERGHKEALKAEFPELTDRIYLLSEMTGVVRDIPDPYGGTLEDFEDTAVELDDLLTRGFDRIIQLATNSKKDFPDL